MQFTVGLQLRDESFLSCILENRTHIQEVYFSWGDFPNGRSNQLMGAQLTPWELQQKQIDALQRISDAGIGLNLLFNANCYGADSQSRAFFEKIGQTADYIQSRFGLASVTTTSPLIAKFMRNNFEGVEVRASVNMEIGTVEGMDYLAQYFDGYYMKRELNRNLAQVEKLHNWCKENGKKLHMLANSGCLNHCSAHNFHDNLVAHEAQIAKMDNAYQFGGICHEYLKDPAHHKALIENTNFIRPEDIPKYEPYFETVKLATRISKNPGQILQSYIRGKYSGDILRLLEPAHSIYPYVLENGDPLKIVRID